MPRTRSHNINQTQHNKGTTSSSSSNTNKASPIHLEGFAQWMASLEKYHTDISAERAQAKQERITQVAEKNEQKEIVEALVCAHPMMRVTSQGQRQGSNDGGGGTYHKSTSSCSSTLISPEEVATGWLKKFATTNNQDDTTSLFNILRRLEKEKVEQGQKVLQLEKEMAAQHQTINKLSIEKADQEQIIQLQSGKAGRRQDDERLEREPTECDNVLQGSDNYIAKERIFKAVQLEKELGGCRRELEEMKKASVRQTEQIDQVVQDYETEIRLLRESNALLSATLDINTRSLEAAQLDKNAFHRQVIDLTEKLEQSKQCVSYLTSIEIKEYQHEVDKLSMECKDYRRQVTKMMMAKRDLLKELQGFRDVMMLAMMKHFEYMEEGDVMLEILEALINKLKH
ncbi:hypothetical protein BG015_007436 [Linnemannia schmuckeri]|uniref:Uncharacterized protein n=1 Tax=Linnemannia schmuckeri TaxID=64567 RepID=A0A9P5VAW7_9FUNG|nr:hypothetical protein BG015_007436 [Linnemannia schmuckeri]